MYIFGNTCSYASNDVYKCIELHFQYCYYYFCVLSAVVVAMLPLYKQAKLVLRDQTTSKTCYKIDMLCYIGSATFIGLKILSDIGYRNIDKISYRCNTSTYACKSSCTKCLQGKMRPWQSLALIYLHCQFQLYVQY